MPHLFCGILCTTHIYISDLNTFADTMKGRIIHLCCKLALIVVSVSSIVISSFNKMIYKIDTIDFLAPQLDVETPICCGSMGEGRMF